jgi:hypothetical protein
MLPRPEAPLDALAALLLASALAAVCATAACAPKSEPPGSTPPDFSAKAGPGNGEARVRALEQAIAADRKQLEELITTPQREERTLREDPRLLEIAERLPRLEEELRKLKIERSAAVSAEAKAP